MSRRREARRNQGSPTDVAIPDKLYFRIGEVSQLTRTKEFVLRYWETQFPSLRPVKGKSGHRLYRRKDVEMVFEIRQLLYEKGFTLEGARRSLANQRKRGPEQPPLFPSALDVTQVRAIRHELQTILTMLKGRC